MNGNIPSQKIDIFKQDIQNWLSVDDQIKILQNKIKTLKQNKKELEPKITLFMVHNNIKDINTDSGKLKCSEKCTKSGLSSKHIRTNLSNVLADENLIEKAMDSILNNRTIKKTYEIRKVKNK
tara:strand:+ start:1127 stop:1495 length:369 start_codon:yes stop_codon:yes gene_type:complete